MRPSVSNSIAPNDTGGAVVTGVHVWPWAVPTEPTAMRQAKRTAYAGNCFMVSVILFLFSVNFWTGRMSAPPQELNPLSTGIRKEKLCHSTLGTDVRLFLGASQVKSSGPQAITSFREH